MELLPQALASFNRIKGISATSAAGSETTAAHGARFAYECSWLAQTGMIEFKNTLQDLPL
jgi:hypothetical protein